MTRRICLKISSWTGISIGAVHWYGKLEDYDGDEWEELRLNRFLTRKEAKDMNVMDEDTFGGVTMGYQAGDTTERFDTEEAVVEAAKAKAQELFGDDFELYRGSRVYHIDDLEKIS